MPQSFASLAAIRDAPFDAIIDVRSPAEYAEDRVPGAISLPVLSNAERAMVGTIYTQDAPFRARKVGAALVARNAAAHIEGPLADMDGGWRPLVYCWRGGQRSGSFVSILSQIGWRADLIAGGYRSYRRLVVAAMHEAALPQSLILLDGYTGTAKTELLALLGARGVQVVDLEGLAAHRGSLFGGTGTAQPAQKGFESALAQAFDRFDPARPVVVEAESSKIGDLLIPGSVWRAMRAAPRFQISAPLQARARYLTRSYADMVADPQVLAATLDQLIPFHGHEAVKAWRALAQAGDFVTLAAQLMQRHYDPRYAKSRGSGVDAALLRLDLPDLGGQDLDQAADRLALACNSYLPPGVSAP